MTDEPAQQRSSRLSRRAVIGLAGVGSALAVGGGAFWLQSTTGIPIRPTGPEVAAAERLRPHTGRVVSRRLRAVPAMVDLGGREVPTWTYDGATPATPIRCSVGDQLQVKLLNDLPEPTTVHWHGLALRNDMDGVPDLTMAPIAPGAQFDYTFVVPRAGTYWFHPHVGSQLDTGLYAPLIVEDPADAGRYDDEAILVLDDWTDGWGQSPSAILAETRRNGMSGMNQMGSTGQMGMPTAQRPLGSDTGDVAYPAHLINGRLPAAPHTIASRPGKRIRLRIINAGSDTAYRFSIGSHRLTVTHTDGFPVRPVSVDTLLIGPAERYDLMITAGDGVFPVVAVPEGKQDPAALAVLRTTAGTNPPSTIRPPELRGKLLSYTDLQADDAVQLGNQKPDRVLTATLTMAAGGRQWLINGRAYGDHQPLTVQSGERVRIVLDNQSMMFHPMHLHGHTFALSRLDGTGIRKDTVNVLPMQKIAVDLDTDNPGQWLMHCHNTYHLELGMATTLSYLT